MRFMCIAMGGSDEMKLCDCRLERRVLDEG